MLPRLAALTLRSAGPALSSAAPAAVAALHASAAPSLHQALFPAAQRSAVHSSSTAYPISGFRSFASAAPKQENDAPVQLHAGLRSQIAAKEYAFEQAYSPSYAESVQPKHRPPVKLHEKLSYRAIQFVRGAFDYATGYKHEVPQTEAQWLRRMIFLETVAGVPGMVAGVLRHLMSLRTMKRDHGWIKTMLEEAENERMHLLTFLELRQPGPLFRLMVILAQGVFFNMYFIAYMVSPKFCHSMVGYLEEEAVKTYTHALSDIDKGHVWKGKPAPAVGINYWKLSKDATMRDLILAIRADEACHSHVNHCLSELKMHDENPFAATNSGSQPETKPPKASLGGPDA